MTAPDADAMLDQVRALLTLGRSGEALAGARMLLAQDPEHAGALFMLSYALMLEGRFAESRDVAKRAVSSAPDSAEMRILLIEAHISTGGKREAIAQARVLQAMATDSSDALYTAARALFHSRKRMREADLLCARAAELAPDDPDVHTLAAAIHWDLGRRRQAMESLTTVLSLDPHDPIALTNLSVVFAARGRFGRSLTIANLGAQFNALNPVTVDMYRQIAREVLRQLLGLMLVALVATALATFALSWWIHVLTATAALVLVAAYLMWIVRQSPAGSPRRLWHQLLHPSGGNRWRALAIAVMTLCVLALGITPNAVAAPFAVVVLVLAVTLSLVLVVFLIARWVRHRWLNLRA